MELCIRKVSGLVPASDQVRSWSRVKVVHDCPKPTPRPIADNGVSDLPANCVGHFNSTGAFGGRYKTNSQRPALGSTSGRRKARKLPAGSDPAGHPD